MNEWTSTTSFNEWLCESASSSSSHRTYAYGPDKGQTPTGLISICLVLFGDKYSWSLQSSAFFILPTYARAYNYYWHTQRLFVDALSESTFHRSDRMKNSASKHRVPWHRSQAPELRQTVHDHGHASLSVVHPTRGQSIEHPSWMHLNISSSCCFLIIDDQSR